MHNWQDSNFEIVRRLEPWFPLLVRVGAASLRDFHGAVPILGLPRKTERANDMHRAFRNNFRRLCDLAEPHLSLVEEAEGQGLDYLICRMEPDRPFILRWGRFNGVRIYRNRTERNRQIQEQGTLFPYLESSASEMGVITLAHTIEDEFTEAGQLKMWIGRLLLIRERKDDSEVITEVHVYQKPEAELAHQLDAPELVIEARENESEEWRKMVDRIRRTA